MKKKIAIIGSGGGGLGAAYLLGSVADVTVYEASSWLGGHARTVDFPCADGVSRPADMGILLTDPWTYPVLYAVLRKHNIETRAAGWTLGASFGKDDWWYTGGPNTDLWKRVRADASRFELDAVRLHNAPIEDKLKPVGYWLSELGYSNEFAAKVLSPMLTLLVVTRTGLLTSPIINILGLFSDKQLSFFNGTQWRMFPGGTRQYVNAMVSATTATFLTSTPVTGVTRTEQGAEITDGSGNTATFDHVVFATPADITLKLLTDATPEEQGLLGAYTWQEAELYLHSDDGVLSKHLPSGLCSQYQYTGPDPQAELQGAFTLNVGAGLGFPKKAGPVLVTGYNVGSDAPRPKAKKVVATAKWQHEIMTLQQMGARQSLHGIQGLKNTWHCGTTAVWPSADAVLASGMVLARHVEPASVFPFDDPASVADFQQIEAVMFPESAVGPGAAPSASEAARAGAPAARKRAVKPGFCRQT
ncbi:MAG: FAD-dependent oxidoreductase [Polyangiaceae bacterium]